MILLVLLNIILDFKISDLISMKNINISIKEISNALIYIIQEKQNNDISIFVSLNEDCEYKMIWSLQINMDDFWDLKNNNITLVESSIKKFKIGQLTLKDNIDRFSSKEIDYIISVKIIDKNTLIKIKETEKLLINKINQDIDIKANDRYVLSSDEDREETEDEGEEENTEEEEAKLKLPNKKAIMNNVGLNQKFIIIK